MVVFIAETTKADLTTAWRIAVLGNSRKLPKDPSELWKGEERKVVPLATMVSMLAADNPKRNRPDVG